MSMRLESPAFRHGDTIPKRYTCDGEDRSPPLRWSGAPAETRSFAILCDDPDAPGGTWSHWALYDVATDVTSLDEGYPTDPAVGATKQAVTDFGRSGYGGPCPPPGHGIHHYHFRVLALKVPTLDLPAGAKFSAVAEATQAHILAKGELMGTYERS